MKFEGWMTNVQKTPLVLKMKLYIKLVHNLERDNCTSMNWNKKKNKSKAQNNGHFQIKVNKF